MLVYIADGLMCYRDKNRYDVMCVKIEQSAYQPYDTPASGLCGSLTGKFCAVGVVPHVDGVAV